MLRADRSLRLNIGGAPELPHVQALEDLYAYPCRPRRGDVVMIVGRSGSGKSTLALFLAAEMNLPTLYFSADMTGYEASIKVACSRLEEDVDGIEEMVEGGSESAALVYDTLRDVNITFSFGEITWRGVEAEVEAYVELHNQYPEVIVIDNLMDVEGCDTEYAAQQEAMQFLHNLARVTGATVIIMHHATDKSRDAEADPYRPPARKDIKNGLGEKPQLTLGVALNPFNNEFSIAVLKQRMGRSDQTGRSYVTIQAVPSHSSFRKKEPLQAMRYVAGKLEEEIDA